MTRGDAGRRRWGLAFLMAGGIAISYLDRVNLSHALVEIKKDLILSPSQQGILLSAFSWGYVLFMLLGGLIVDRFGPVRTAAAAATLWSLATAWTGAASGYVSLLTSRILIGISEAPIFPANARLVRENFPVAERGRATALFDSGSYVGTALSAPIVVPVIVYIGWRFSFFVCAALGLLWVGLWLARSRQLRSASQNSGGKERRVSLRHVKLFARNRAIWGASFGFFCYNYNKSFFLTWFPTYLIEDRHVRFLSIGLIGAIPPLAALLGEAAGGFATDRLVRRGHSLTVARKLPLCLGLVVGSLIAIPNAIASTPVAIGLLSLAFAGTISASPAIWAIPGDIAPDPAMVGTIGGIQNTISNLAGIVAPIVTGALVSRFDSFTPALACSGGVTCLGALSYWLLMGRIETLKLDE